MDLELGIRKTIAEWVGRFDAESIKIPVSDIDSLMIIGIIQIAAQVTESRGRWIIRIVFCPGHGKMAGGRFLAGQHIRQSVSADVAGLAHQEQRADSLFRAKEFGIYHSAHIQHDDYIPICIGKCLDVVFFNAGQFIVPGRDVPVCPLSGIAGNDVNRRVRSGFFNLFRRDFRSLRLSRPLGKQLNKRRLPFLRQKSHDPVHGLLHRLLANAIILIQPFFCCDDKAGLLQTLLHIDDQPGIDIT